MSNLARIRSKLDFIATLNPQAWDAVHPHTQFVFSNAHVELLVAAVNRPGLIGVNAVRAIAN